jgi:hypothetical protein
MPLEAVMGTDGGMGMLLGGTGGDMPGLSVPIGTPVNGAKEGYWGGAGEPWGLPAGGLEAVSVFGAELAPCCAPDVP